MSEFLIKYASKKVEVFFENGIIHTNWSILDNSKRYLVITDTNLTKLYGKLLSNIPNLITIISIKSGELAKSFSVYEKIICTLQKVELRKNDVIIAFGGGVIGDLTGFIASTYLKGIEYIQVPTTIVAGIDASIGGKCGINYQYKDNIGSIYHPSKIIIDGTFFKTLPKMEIIYGLAVMIKYGFIKDSSIIDDLEKFSFPFKKEIFMSLIERSLKIKMSITQKDEFDKTDRRLLNFGLSYGHIIETNSKFKISYGQALAYGMYYELEHSPFQEKMLELLKKYNLANNIEKWNIDFYPYLKFNKNATSDSIEMVEIPKIGNAKVVTKML